MGKVHFEPYFCKDDDIERAMCGIKVGEDFEHHHNWTYVTCKLCLKKRDKIERDVEITEKIVVDQMQGMVDFFNS